jgi:hypothetical protein
MEQVYLAYPRRSGLPMNDLLRRLLFTLRASAGLLAISLMAFAQFKEIGPAPFSPAEAHRKIRVLLDQVDAGSRQQTVRTIIGWLDWYRDVLDEELIASWKSDKRANLSLVMNELGDSRVASEVLRSWRQPGLNRADAPVLSGLMTRYSDTAGPFFRDLLQTPDLSPPETEAVCRVLLDVPDRWRADAMRILPHYHNAAQSLLAQDLQGGDQETIGRAEFWLRDLKWDIPGSTSTQRAPARRQTALKTPGGSSPITSADTSSSRPHIALPDRSDFPEAHQPLAPRGAGVPQITYNGPRSGTLTCSGLVPQNAEFVFRNLPPVELKLEYDSKLWSARLLPGEGETQRLILRNISSGPQKKCAVHWSTVQ